jgi:hypothetical protein
MLKQITLLALALLLAAPSTFADRRKFVWSYQYGTIAPGNAELEFYQTTKLDRTDSWEYRIEVEHGLSPRWDLAVYQIFSQKQGESFKWDAVQVRARYRLAEPGVMLLDPLLYLEYRRKIDLQRQNKAEVKLILSRNFDRFALAVNPVYEFFWAPGDPVHELGLDVGLAYEPSMRFTIGVESTTRIKYLKDADNTTGSYLGPTFSYSSGGMFYTLGYAWGLTDDSNDARVRFIMGIEL